MTQSFGIKSILTRVQAALHCYSAAVVDGLTVIGDGATGTTAGGMGGVFGIRSFVTTTAPSMTKTTPPRIYGKAPSARSRNGFGGRVVIAVGAATFSNTPLLFAYTTTRLLPVGSAPKAI